MSNLNGLLLESEKTDERLKQAIVSGDYDLMTKIERSKSELNSRIFFAKRDDYAERLNDLRIEKESVAALQTELADELKLAAADVMAARNALYEAESAHAAIKAKQYFLDNQSELCRKNINETTVDLDRHIKSRLNGVSGSIEMPTIDLMEINQC
jgi:chromosome segregation ATPase